MKNINICNDVNKTVHNITQQILSAAKNNIPKSSPTINGHKTVPWWNQEINKAIKLRKKILRFFKRFPTKENKINYLKARSKSRYIIETSKQKSFQEFTSSLNDRTPSKIVWDKIRSINGRKKPTNITSLLNDDGIIITNQSTIVEILAEQFAKTSKNNDTNQYEERITRNSRSKTKLNENSNSLNNIFSYNELEYALKNCKGSSAGIDNIHYEFVQNMHKKNKTIILKMFNNIWETDQFPKSWKTAMIIPIHKQGKDPKKAINYRPISLISCLCKIMERIINRRIMHYLEKNEKLSNNQFAFRKQKSTMDNIIILESYISEAFLESKNVCAIFYDINKAYDKTNRKLIIDTASAA